MDAKKLIEFRREAEKAVADMQDGELKVKAFEVILSHLISTSADQTTRISAPQQKGHPESEADEFPTESVAGRLMVLREEGFFKPRGHLPR